MTLLANGALGPYILALGCVLLLGLQFTGFRHPPAMASGGAVLYGLDPFAVGGCVAITGVVLIAESFVVACSRRSI